MPLQSGTPSSVSQGQERSFNRIFCIGINKSGTTSLHYAFLELGLRSLHHGIPPSEGSSGFYESVALIESSIRDAVRNGTPLLEYCDNFDAYSDITAIIANFPLFDQQYPGSKFIYTDRDEESWIRSRMKHVEKNRSLLQQGIYKGRFLEIDIEKWVSGRKRLLAAVSDYFKDRQSDLLFIRICDGEGYEKLCPFLGLEIPLKNFPHKNRLS